MHARHARRFVVAAEQDGLSGGLGSLAGMLGGGDGSWFRAYGPPRTTIPGCSELGL